MKKKKERKKNARASSSWRLGNMTVAYAQSIYPLIKVSSILKKRRKMYLELKTQMRLELLPLSSFSFPFLRLLVALWSVVSISLLKPI